MKCNRVQVLVMLEDDFGGKINSINESVYGH